MESEWRLNVWRLGITQEDVRLAARLLIGSEPVYVTDRRRHLGQWEYFQPNIGQYGGSFYGSTPITPAHPHFPFGQAVRPDHPA